MCVCVCVVRGEEEEELMLCFGIEMSCEMDTKSVCHLGLRTFGYMCVGITLHFLLMPVYYLKCIYN